MLIVEVKQGENIERALKKFKNKVRKVKQVQQLRENQHFTKKSVARREEISKARYRQYLQSSSEN